MELGKTIKRLRINAQLSQLDFAEKLNVHVQTVSKWERDISLPDFSVLGIIAENLNVPFDALFDIEDKQSVSGVFSAEKMGDAIRKLRQRQGLTQKELADAVGVSADIVSKWERGIVCPDVDKFLEISKFFKVLPSEIYYFKLPKQKEKKKNKKPRKKLTKRQRKIVCFSSIILAVIISLVSGHYIYSCTKPISFTSPLKTLTVLREDKMYFCGIHQRYCMPNGLDFSVNLGDEVYAIMDGRVTEVVEATEITGKDVENLGVEVTIQNRGYKATYWSIQLASGIKVGSWVKKGDLIGKVGNHHRLRCQKNDAYSLHVQIYNGDEKLDLMQLLKTVKE